MSEIKWNNLNPFGSRRGKSKGKESKYEGEKTVGGKRISLPIPTCPQCNVLYFDTVCTSCGYRNGPNDQGSDDSDVSPKTRTRTQQAQDHLDNTRAHTPVAPSTAVPSDSMSNHSSNRMSDTPPNSGVKIRGQSVYYAHGYGRRRSSDTREWEVDESSTPTPAPRVQPGNNYPSSYGTANISSPYSYCSGEYSPRCTPRPTPPPTSSKPFRLVEEHELQNMKDVDLEADGEQTSRAGSSKRPNSCCKFPGNMRHDLLGLMIVGGVILAIIIVLGVLAASQSKKSQQAGS